MINSFSSSVAAEHEGGESVTTHDGDDEAKSDLDRTHARLDSEAAARRTDVERDHAIWEGIRRAQEQSTVAQRLAAQAIHENAVHKAECDGRYKVIDTKLGLIIWLLGGIATIITGIGTSLIVHGIVVH